MAGNAWPGREDQYEIMTGASGSWGWCHIDDMAIRLNLKISECDEESNFEVVMAGNVWPGREDQYEIMTGASGSWGCCHIDGYTT